MKRVDFLLLDVASPVGAAEIARRHGWFAGPAPRGVMRSLPPACTALELRNLNAPVGIVVIASETRYRAIGAHVGAGRWGIDAKLSQDEAEFLAIVEDAPVVQHLVHLLDAEPIGNA